MSVTTTLPVIPGYTVLKRLAVGGMGQVFLARRDGAMGFSKLVALKQLLPAYAKNADFLAMFGNEATVAGLMAHKNLLATYDCGVSGGLPYLAMEFIHGLSLREVMKRSLANRQAIPPVTMAHIAMQVLEGLDAAHETRDREGASVGLVHRDLSPPNILVGFDGLVKVLDFGIAKCTEGEPLTATPMVKGRFAYMPPEQIRGEPVDRRADIFAVGAILYEVLSGQRAFPGPTVADVVRQVAACEVRPLSEVAPGLPVALADVVMKSLSADRQWRFSTAREMAAALRASVDGMLGLSVVRLLESLSTKDERTLHLAARPELSVTMPVVVGTRLPSGASARASPPPARPSPKVTVPSLPPPDFDPMAETRPVRLDVSEVPTSETMLPAEPRTIIASPFGPVAPPPLPPRLASARRLRGVTGFFRAMFRPATA
jgi:serine/threonine protein kinase